MTLVLVYLRDDLILASTITLVLQANRLTKLWQYYRDIPAVNNDGGIVDFNGANVTDLFNFKS